MNTKKYLINSAKSTEEGIKVTGYDGKALDYSKPFNGAVVSNGIVLDQLIEMLK